MGQPKIVKRPKFRISRSHLECAQECRWKRFLTYHFMGTGVVPKGNAIHLLAGGLAHGILEDVLQVVAERDTIPDAVFVRERIKNRRDEFIEQLAGSAVERPVLASGQDQWEAYREAALIEGLVRAWLKYRLPTILNEYRVLEVEKEFDTHIESDLWLMTRIDGTLRRRADNELAALEFKTTSIDRAGFFEAFRYDTQTLSHLFALEEKYGEVATAVQMEFLYKGYKREGLYYSPIVTGFRQIVVDPLTGDTTINYNVENPRRKGWERFNVWEGDFQDKPEWMSPMEYWVEHVMDYMQCARQLFFCPVYRNERDLKEWLDTVAEQEAANREGLTSFEQGNITLDELRHGYFPANMNRHCYYGRYGGKPCPYLPICYGQVDLDKVVGSDLYEIREPHHPQELEE